MGEVLLAHDTLLKRPVALKRLRPGDAGDVDAAERRSAVLREARRASQIGDRRIAAIHDVLTLDDDVWIVMEYVDGTNLRERMTQPISLEVFFDIATQCLDALGAAHAHGVVHRDIKPENLMLTTDGQIKVLDFGIAKRAEAADGMPATITTTTASHRDDGLVVGTPQYMAPEAHYGGRIDERTDLFSLGVVFYELLTLRHPFAGATYDAVLHQIMNATPARACDLDPRVGGRLSDVVGKMIEKDPAQRYASCSAVRTDLVAARDTSAVSPERATRGPTAARRSKTAPWARVAWSLGAVAIVAALALWRPWAGATLPKDRNLAVLAPATPQASPDFASSALGLAELLSARLQRHQDRAGFQLASFQEGLEEKVGSAADARKVLGANLAILPTLEQGPNGFRGRIELWDTAREQVIGSRLIETPVAKPFEFLDRLYLESAGLLGLAPRRSPTAIEYGIRGAGTLRFVLQGIGRIRSAKTEPEVLAAVADLELACRAEPEASVPRAWLSGAYYRAYGMTKDAAWLAKAERSAREAVGLDSTRAEGHRMLASVLGAQRNMPASLLELERACTLNPTDDDALTRLGRAYGAVGQPEQERETYVAAIERRPHCWKPYWLLATWHFREGHVDESIRAYGDMIRRAPDLCKGYSSLGGLLALRGDYDAAIDTLRHSIALRPTKTAFDNLGTAYFHSGRLNETIDAYNQALQFGFADYLSWLNLGDAYYWLRNREDQAAEAYAQAVRLGREESRMRAQTGRAFDVMIPANLAAVFPKLDQPDSARLYLRHALHADSTNAMVQYCAALTFWQLHDKGRAIAWLDRAIAGGYPTAWLKDSPEFEPWRAEDSFRALIAEASQQPTSATQPAGGR